MTSRLGNHDTIFAIGEASATQYEMLLTRVTDEKSKSCGKYILTVLNFRASVELHNLRQLATKLKAEIPGYGNLDYANIQNILADFVEEVEKLDVDEFLREQRV
ncbi:hypothetical protein CN495_08775 [Bacillus thuringiensis]|uniref:Uncharacterized protein n=1 Tax=Bacillus thuringiensis TaxID=1428 RepID=A0ABD6S9W6_BACTU|nr:hypothetical protein [Bacillus thuringiensis]PER55835.1 hypothetical protein CN495_08775 [Bacillus thuringiensis]